MEKGFFDIHHHLIYGMDDDGPKTFQETCNMVRAASTDGITNIIATPHAIPGIVPFPIEVFADKVREVREYCQREGIDITIYPGAEILFTDMTIRLLKEKRIPTMVGTFFVLVEFRPDIRFDHMANALKSLIQSGYLPILAHAERYRCLVLYPKRVSELRYLRDIYFQINGSFLSARGDLLMKRFLKWVLDHDLIDTVATDAHNTRNRSVSMQEAYKWLCATRGKEYADGMTRNLGLMIIEESLYSG